MEVRNLLTMIKSGNTTKESKKTDSALIKTVSAFGIAGKSDPNQVYMAFKVRVIGL